MAARLRARFDATPRSFPDFLPLLLRDKFLSLYLLLFYYRNLSFPFFLLPLPLDTSIAMQFYLLTEINLEYFPGFSMFRVYLELLHFERE